MWMQAQTGVDDMFEIKINAECFFTLSQGRTNESDHTCQDQTLQTKAACSFINEQRKSL